MHTKILPVVCVVSSADVTVDMVGDGSPVQVTLSDPSDTKYIIHSSKVLN